MRRYLEFSIVNLFLLGVLAVFLTISHYQPGRDMLLYSSDAVTYFSAGAEFFRFDHHGSSITRPFLYPALLRGLYELGGAHLVVWTQLLGWVVTGNFIYFGLLLLLKKRVYPIVGLLLFALNLSLIGYAFHGLTEIATSVLLACLVYTLIKHRGKKPDVSLYLRITFLLALLTLIKPLFWYPFLGVLMGGVIVLYKQLWKSRKAQMLLLLVLLPIGFQMSAMYVKYGRFEVSRISKLTFDKYLLTQGIGEESGADRAEALEQMRRMTEAEKKDFFWDHRGLYATLFVDNIEENIGAQATFFYFPEYRRVKFYKHMNRYNEWLLFGTKVFLGIFIVFLFWKFRIRKIWEHWHVWFIGLLLFYCITASGISFFQGDRLIIFTLPLWIVLYLQLLETCGKGIIHLFKFNKSQKLDEIRSH